jgi:hypothetical protein
MKVKATQLGYYGNRRRREGEVFHVEDKLFSESWMLKLEGGGSPPPVQAAEVVEEVPEESSEDEVI